MHFLPEVTGCLLLYCFLLKVMEKNCDTFIIMSCFFRKKFEREENVDNTTAYDKEETQKGSETKKVFSCTYCKYKSKYKRHFNRHINAIHTKEISYKCDNCTYVTYTQTQLALHKRTHLNKKLYICEICKQGFNRKQYLNAHFSKHNELKSKCVFHECKYCQYKSEYLSNVKQHENMKHTKSIKYFCDKCQYFSTKKSHLKSHIYTHKTKKPFKCVQCDYQAAQSSNLKIHIKSKHT